MNEICEKCKLPPPKHWRGMCKSLGFSNSKIRFLAQKQKKAPLCWAGICLNVRPKCVYNYPFEVILNPNTRDLLEPDLDFGPRYIAYLQDSEKEEIP